MYPFLKLVSTKNFSRYEFTKNAIYFNSFQIVFFFSLNSIKNNIIKPKKKKKKSLHTAAMKQPNFLTVASKLGEY